MKGFHRRWAALVTVALLIVSYGWSQAHPAAETTVTFSAKETLSYSIEWRLIYAGSARLSLAYEKPAAHGSDWESKLHLESGGLVSKLYKLDDNYAVQLEDQFCAASSAFDAVEGSRHHETRVTFDRDAHKAHYQERDLLKNATIRTAETDIPVCVSDIIGALYKLRMMHLDPGQSTQISISDGKKSVAAKIEAQEREEVTTKAGAFHTIRYEAFVFNGVLYKKSARLLLWLTEDSRKLPVQLRARMPFPIGSITFQLDKEDRS